MRRFSNEPQYTGKVTINSATFTKLLDHNIPLAEGAVIKGMTNGSTSSGIAFFWTTSGATANGGTGATFGMLQNILVTDSTAFIETNNINKIYVRTTANTDFYIYGW